MHKFKLLNTFPIQIRSKSLTHSQINTNKPVQGFLAMVFEKTDKSDNTKELNDNDYKNLIQSLINQATKEGYKSKSDKYDFIITKLFPNYVIKDFII